MKRINFDHLSCSPILPESLEVILSLLSSEDIGNPLSRHIFGDKPGKALDEARSNVAGLIGARDEEIIFTSCGSESNNLAIKGIASAHAKKGRHIIATPIEHHSVIHPLKNLEKQGYEISWLHVDKKGNLDIEEISRLIRKDTILITVTSASSEIGTLEPIEEIGKTARANNVIFHTDAVACTGFIPLDVKKYNIDLLSMAGNIFYGPPGTGALYLRKGMRIFPQIEGGIQENGLRAGTHNIAGIAGMGIAAKIAREKLTERREYLNNLREKLINGILEKVPDCFLTGERTNRLPGHASICIKFIEGESVLMSLNFLGIAGATGSTCSSEASKISHVLKAIGIDPIWAQGSLVLSLGIDNTIEDVDIFLDKLPFAVERLREMSPLVKSEDIGRFRWEIQDAKV